MTKHLITNTLKNVNTTSIIKMVRFDLSKNQERIADIYDRSKIEKTPLYLQMREIEPCEKLIKKVKEKVYELGKTTLNEIISNFKEEDQMETIAAIRKVTIRKERMVK